MPGSLARLLRRAPPASWLACEACGSRCVCPLDWEAVDDEHWWVACRCGECGHRHEVRLSNAQAACWDVELCRQTDEIARAAQQLDRERMSAQADAFIAALRRDLVTPADFA
jgi:hypothetical protein